MSSVEYLREFVNERLTAAAEEIFGFLTKTIVDYEKEIDRQRRLLDVVWKPEIKLHKIELPQEYVCPEEEEEEEEEVLPDQQLCIHIQEKNPSLDQEDPDPPQIKEEEEELCTGQEGEQLVLKQETDAFMFIPTYEESDHGEDQILCFTLDETQSVVEEKPLNYKSFVVPEPKSDLFHSSRESESQDQRGSRRDAEPGTKNPHHSVYNPAMCHQCDTCGKAFKFKSQMHLHRRTHTNERPYSCNTCGKRFRQASTLSGHVRIHTGEKPYSCNTCGKTFSQASTLNAHIRIHTGEKPYSCNTCGKRFRRTTDVRAHIRTHR